MSTAPAGAKPGTEVEMTFAWIPPGHFLMGREKDEDESQDDEPVHQEDEDEDEESDEDQEDEESSDQEYEAPVHRVTITKGFWMGIYPVTQRQFEAVMGYNPSRFRGADRPVENVNWFDAQEFCKAFGNLTDRPIRLPTEAEWEYACRAGETSDYWNGNDATSLDRVAWYGGEEGPSKGQTRPVGKLEKNPWGLYDVHGNVWQWCQDAMRTYSIEDQIDPQEEPSDSNRVLRGGAWDRSPDECRAAYRGGSDAADRGCDVGFRVCFRLD